MGSTKCGLFCKTHKFKRLSRVDKKTLHFRLWFDKFVKSCILYATKFHDVGRRRGLQKISKLDLPMIVYISCSSVQRAAPREYMSLTKRRQRDQRLTCTVLSRTTWDTVSRSCAAMPGFPRPRVNFLSLILVNAVRRRSDPGSVSPSDATAPAASGCIGHRGRPPGRGTIEDITRNRPGRLVTIDQDRATNSRRPSPIASRRVASCLAAPRRAAQRRWRNRQSHAKILSPFLSSLFPPVSNRGACADFYHIPLLSCTNRCDAPELERINVKSRYEVVRRWSSV